ncbi:RING finger protein 141-like [Frankliniella occidentalis]|uniref:RING finger protein 141-like n=1 Tax=Frankliniella occidentalis TaxID=133901 RepID=A0A9C6X9I6_FRAOC|nr:RING finger protein 141-like [Frankliniella occidentalis]
MMINFKICRPQTGLLSAAGPQDNRNPTDKNNQEPTEDEMCAICLGPKKDKMTLDSFCKICIKKWIDFAGNCPICKRDVDVCEVPF